LKFKQTEDLLPITAVINPFFNTTLLYITFLQDKNQDYAIYAFKLRKENIFVNCLNNLDLY